jgi:hypothetical protein
MRRRGQPAVAYLMGATLCFANPFVWEAIFDGHSREALSGVLCIGAVLAALRGRRTGAAGLLGVAIAADPWALVAALPVLAAFPGGWRSGRRAPDDLLALVALMFLLGGLLQPGGFVPDLVPVMLALVAWEGLTRSGPPLVSVVLVLTCWLFAHAGVPAELAALPVGAWVAVRLFMPSFAKRRRAWPLPVQRTPATR